MKSLFAIANVLMVALLISYNSHAAGSQPPLNVDVVNTPNVNVVNQPTVNVGNTPNVSATITGTPNVNVSNAESSQPFQQMVRFDFGSGGSLSSSDLLTVPTGKRLIVKSASFEASLPSGGKIIRGSISNSGPGRALHFLIPSFVGTDSDGLDTFIGSGQVLLYVEAGETLRVLLEKSTTTATGVNQLFTVSGYFVDVP